MRMFDDQVPTTAALAALLRFVMLWQSARVINSREQRRQREQREQRAEQRVDLWCFGGRLTIRWLQETGKFKGIAYVQFEDDKTTAVATQLNNSLLNGRPITVDFAVIASHWLSLLCSHWLSLALTGSHYWLSLLALIGSHWLSSLALVGSNCLLALIIGSFWLPLELIGSNCLLALIIGSHWLSLTLIDPHYWLSLTLIIGSQVNLQDAVAAKTLEWIGATPEVEE